MSKIPNLKSPHDDTALNIHNLVIDTVNALGRSIQDLVLKGQLTAGEYAQLLQELNGLISKGQVSVHDIDKNKGLLDQSFLSPELLEQIAGTAPILSTLADGAVTNTKLANGSVTSTKLGDYSVSESKLANGAVTSGKIADNSVGNRSLMTNGVHHDNIADLAVRERHLAAGVVTKNKIATGIVDETHIGVNSKLINKGKEFPLKNFALAGVGTTMHNNAKNFIINATVSNAKHDKVYQLDSIRNGYGTGNSYGLVVSSLNKPYNGSIYISSKKRIINFSYDVDMIDSNDGYTTMIARSNEPGGEIVSITFKSDFGSLLNLAENEQGNSQGAIIDPSNYTYKNVNVGNLLENKGALFPFANMNMNGTIHDINFRAYDNVLDAKVDGAEHGKVYQLESIRYNYFGNYGIYVSSYSSPYVNVLYPSTKNRVITLEDDLEIFRSSDTNLVTMKATNNDGLTVTVTFDPVKMTELYNLAENDQGNSKGLIIHPNLYNYSSGGGSTVVTSSEDLITLDKKEDRLFIYFPLQNKKYLGYEITHYQKALDSSAASNYDLWSVRTIKEYNRVGNTFNSVRSIIDHTTPTTMDLMIKENDDMDYMGGIHHGDEVNEFLMLIVDGKEIKDVEIGMYEAKEVRLIQRNKLYRDTVSTGGTLNHLGTVGKEHIFNKNGYTLSNTVTWHESINIVQAFLGNLSLYRKDDKGKSPLWHTAINDITHTPFSLKTVGGQMPSAENLERLILTGDGVGCTIEIERLNNVPGNASWVANFAEVNSKFYSSYVPNGYTTKVGEVWKQKTNFNFELF